MKKSSGFGLGFAQSSFSPVLGQVQPSVSEGGEPDLSRALSTLSAAEADDYRGWGAPEKTLFLLGYQYIAVASAKNLLRPDAVVFDGFFSNGLSTAFTLLSTASKYSGALGSLAGALDGMSSILKDASDKTEPGAEAIVRKYRGLRDRVAWEMANSGVTVQYDVVGDDPANPGAIYQRTIGENRAPDLNAVFSFDTPADMYRMGKDLESKYAQLGVQFDRPSLGSAALPILGVIIAVIVGILIFFWLFWDHQDRAKLNSTTVDLVTSDPNLTAAQKAELLGKLSVAQSFWKQVFGDFPWTTAILTAGLVAIAFFVAPAWLSRRAPR